MGILDKLIEKKDGYMMMLHSKIDNVKEYGIARISKLGRRELFEPEIYIEKIGRKEVSEEQPQPQEIETINTADITDFRNKLRMQRVQTIKGEKTVYKPRMKCGV